MTIQFELIDEFRLTPEVREGLRVLLHTCFADSAWTQSRHYGKQLPQRRLIARDNQQVIGQVALEHRVIGLCDGPAEIFGLIEVCVLPSHRGQGIASHMLSQVEQLAGDHHVEFLLLFADHEELYINNGYRYVNHTVRWAKIDEHKLLGIGEEVVSELMIKELTPREWPSGTVDLMGYLF